jgi:hypothetical protein
MQGPNDVKHFFLENKKPSLTATSYKAGLSLGANNRRI